MSFGAEGFTERLKTIREMHDLLRMVCLAPATPEGHYVNENTVVRLAAMMEAERLAPPKEPKCVQTLRQEEQADYRARRFSQMSDAERTVRTLFLLRHLIVHRPAGRFLPTGNSTYYERAAYGWFCSCHPDAKVEEGETLRLPFNTVIVPLCEGCTAYARQRLSRHTETVPQKPSE
jgi:hypothetical protein